MTKIYLAHPISTKADFNDSIRIAKEIRALGFEVYAAAENSSINDKKNNPTPRDIYDGDISKIVDADLFVVNLTGGHQDGTISEIGLVSGYNHANGGFVSDYEDYRIPIIAYTSNARLHQPQFSDGIPSAGANHLVKGMIDRWGIFVKTEDDMYEALKSIKDVNFHTDEFSYRNVVEKIRENKEKALAN